MKCANHTHALGREGTQKAMFTMYYYNERDMAIHPESDTGENLCRDCAREVWLEGWGLSETGLYSIARDEMRAMRRQYINDFRHDKVSTIRDRVRNYENQKFGMTLSLYI